jgi:8-oxo-dGTP pyrophosphatase MutT (NUDIX family)
VEQGMVERIGPGKRGLWTVRESDRIYGNPWIEVSHHEVLTPNGTPGIYGVVGLVHDAVGVVPIDADGNTVLVGQHRFPRDYYSWELPEGVGAKGRPAREAAVRELAEETGLTAGRWMDLLVMDLSNAISDERAYGFLAWDLTAGPSRPDEAELLETRRLPFAEAVEMAMRGEIIDAFSQAMLFKTDLMRRRGELPADLALLLV